MNYGNYDFASGTAFERMLMQYMWEKYPDNKKSFCKPDIYDVSDGTFYEAKYTRPYYDGLPDHPDSVDIGTGLPANQFYRYKQIFEEYKGHVILIHGMTEGRHKDCIFWTQLSHELISKARRSYNKKTVYWIYADLTLITRDCEPLLYRSFDKFIKQTSTTTDPKTFAPERNGNGSSKGDESQQLIYVDVGKGHHMYLPADEYNQLMEEINS